MSGLSGTEAALAVGAGACLMLVGHTYVLFPALLTVLARRARAAPVTFAPADPHLPAVEILLAAYNEEQVIEEKIRRTFATTYPADRLTLTIGSDASTDGTDHLVQRLQTEFGPDRLRLMRFAGRTGKTQIINALAAAATAPVLVLTDANVFFAPDTVFELVKYFAHPKVGLVGGNILNEEVRCEGISVQEKAYLLRENQMKHAEGVIWGATIGAFGGCYAVRRAAFRPVPPTYLVDDFFLSMQVLADGWRALNALEAVAFEDVSNELREEFRRKVRIATGNFQNLRHFRRLLWPPWGRVGFAFWSHKVLRWITPHLLLTLLLLTLGGVAVSAPGSVTGWLWSLLLAGQLAVPALLGLDWALRRAGIHNRLLRFITHFYAMNAALLRGWWRSRGTIESSVWTPTRRFQ